jgi:hypothetical protein
MVNHYLWHHVEKAAAQNGYELQIYRPDTDHVGVDVLFDDQRTIRPLQVKTVLSDATTSSWDIHSRLLKPTAANHNKFGIRAGGSPGLEGGVILFEIHPDGSDDIEISARYFDIYILKMYLKKVIKNNKYFRFDTVKNIYRSLSDTHNDQVTIPESLFVKVRDMAALLGIAGLKCAHSDWVSYRYSVQEMAMNGPVPNAQMIFDSFSQLVQDNRIVFASG